MTSDEADQRIALSRRTLAEYAKKVDGPHWPLADLYLFPAEIEVLESIAEAYPSKTGKLIVLVEESVKLRERLFGKMH